MVDLALGAGRLVQSDLDVGRCGVDEVQERLC